MDLAQAASIFKQSDNLNALGICYNNIANIHYKNQKYEKASINFKKAMSTIKDLINKKKDEDIVWDGSQD